jgi:gamma-glutamyltranspeptidase/glutathione hydrolase
MLSSMTPTFMESADKVTVLGTPGGTRIITMVLLGMLGYDAGLDAQEVAALPRYHHQWLPDLIQAESGAFAPGTTHALRTMGHELKGGDEAGLGSSHRWGNLQTVKWDKRTDTLSTGSDPRNPVGAGRVELAPVP